MESTKLLTWKTIINELLEIKVPYDSICEWDEFLDSQSCRVISTLWTEPISWRPTKTSVDFVG